MTEWKISQYNEESDDKGVNIPIDIAAFEPEPKPVKRKAPNPNQPKGPDGKFLKTNGNKKSYKKKYPDREGQGTRGPPKNYVQMLEQKQRIHRDDLLKILGCFVAVNSFFLLVAMLVLPYWLHF